MQMILAIGLGGALGAILRHFMAGAITRWFGSGFPLGIMLVNILGSLLMGFLVTALATRFEASPEMRGFIAVGLLGGFTTFSTFSLETVLLMERGELMQAALYILGSVFLAVAGLMAGMWLARTLL